MRITPAFCETTHSLIQCTANADYRPQRRTACVHLYKRKRGDGDDVMNDFYTNFRKPIANFLKKVYNILTTEQTGACIQAERKV